MENFNKETPDSHTLLDLRHLAQRKVAFRTTPLNVPEGDSLVRIVNGAANALLALDAGIGAAQGSNDAPIPITELRQRIAGLFVSVQVRLAAANAAVTRARDALKVAEDAFYLPPARDDVAGVLLDVELRAFYASGNQEALLDQMAHGQHGELLDALARFGPSPSGQIAREIRRGIVATADPDKPRDFANEHERIEWAAVVLAEVTAALDQGSMLTGVRDAVAEPEAQRRAA